MRLHGCLVGYGRRQELWGVTDDLWPAEINGITQEVQETEPCLGYAVVVQLNRDDVWVFLTYGVVGGAGVKTNIWSGGNKGYLREKKMFTPEVYKCPKFFLI